MRQAAKVLTTIAALGLCATAAQPAGADDRIALVGCDLLADGGPEATFLQIAGEKRKKDDFRFVFRSGDGVSDGVAGRRCAEVLADLADDGFEFLDADVSEGSFDEWVSIWRKDD
jgi:hypothetical protein